MSSVESARRSRMLRFVIAGLAITCFVASGLLTANAYAQSESKDPAPTSEGNLTEQLSKGSYSSRQRATLKMWGARDQLRDEVQQAARHSDPEVAERANWILKQWRRGSVPGMPPRVARLLQQGDDPEAIQELVELGRFGAAVIAIEESAGSIEFDAIKERVSKAVRLRFPFYVKQAIEEDTLGELLELINVAAFDHGMAASRIRLMKELGLSISDEQLLPKASETWTQLDRNRATISLLASQNRFDDALKRAREMREPELARKILSMSGHWQELAREALAIAEAPETISPIGDWIEALTAADRAGDNTIRAKAVEALKAVSSDDINFSRSWKALCIHGEVETALSMMTDEMPEAVTDVALAASRPKYAFDQLGFPITKVDRELNDWIEDAVAAQQSTPELTTPCLEIRKLLCLMKCLLAVGRYENAWEIAERLSHPDLKLGQGPRDRLARDLVLQRLILTSKKEWIFKLAVSENETAVSPTAQWCAARILPDTDSQTFSVLLSSLLSMYRKASFEQRFQMACDLLDGKIPEGFEPERDFTRLFERLTKPQLSQFGRQVGVPQRSSLNHEFVKLFARHGQSDLAAQCLQQLMMQGDIEAMYESALTQANSGQSELAEKFYRLTWNRARSKGRGNYLLKATEEDSTFAAKSLIDEWFVSRRSHDRERSELLERQLRTMLCSPSTSFLNEIASYLGQRGEHEMANEVYNSILPLAWLDEQEESDFYDIAQNFSGLVRQDNPAEALRWFDLAVIETLDSTYFRSSAYISLPLYIQQAALDVAIEDKDAEAAERVIRRVNQLDVLDISFAEDLLPKMREAGMAKLANNTFDVMFEIGKSHVKMFPFDATTGNNVAWVAAMNDRRLPEALELSEFTVYVEPDSAIYRDTLAEILFRLDRKREALHIEETCVLDDPGQWHLHVQIEKYRQAIAETP